MCIDKRIFAISSLSGSLLSVVSTSGGRDCEVGVLLVTFSVDCLWIWEYNDRTPNQTLCRGGNVSVYHTEPIHRLKNVRNFIYFHVIIGRRRKVDSVFNLHNIDIIRSLNINTIDSWRGIISRQRRSSNINSTRTNEKDNEIILVDTDDVWITQLLVSSCELYGRNLHIIV